MRKLKILVVEDLYEDRLLLQRTLQKFENWVDFENLQIATSYDEAISFIDSGYIFELSILDITLGNKDCFDLLRDSQNKAAFGFVFLKTTNLEKISEFRIASSMPNIFELSNSYYEESLRIAFSRLAIEMSKVIELPQRNFYYNLIAGGQTKVENIDDILFIEADRKQCNIFFQELDSAITKQVVDGLLQHYESLLLGFPQFLRIQKSLIININNIIGTGKRKTDCEIILSRNKKLESKIVNYSRDDKYLKELKRRTGLNL